MVEDMSIMSQLTINRIKIITMYIMSIFYVSVGVNHFVEPDWFTQIVPPYLAPYDLALVYLSGVFEILFGILILINKTRYYAAWGLIFTLAAVFPANIYLAQSNGVAMDTSAAIAWYRLPFQSLFIVLAYWHRK
tara:strand:- start:58 stop:459 length:402 start_codon:yes stop_codon:yes gene_type:complete